MVDVRDVIRSKIKSTGGSEPTSVSEVKKAAEDIDIITQVTDRAAKLVGLDKLEKERKDMEQKLELTKVELEKQKMETLNKELAEIKAALKAATEQRDIPAIKELERRLDEARETYHKEQLEGLRQQIAEIRKPEKGAGDIAADIKKIKEVSKELGLTSEVTATPPDILLQLKKMDQELQLKLEEMKDERDRRDKEWQLTLKKWEEERELRKEEAKLKYQVEQERTDTLKSAFDRGARIIGRAISEGEEEGETAGKITYHVEATEGEMGDFDCPRCKSPVAVAPDATRAICAKCGFTAGIKRTKKVEPQT